MQAKTLSFKLTVLTTSLAFVMAQLDVSIVNIALTQIAKAYATDISGLQWVIDAYTLAFAVLMLSAGSLTDMLGARRVFQLGMCCFGIASLGCGMAPTLVWQIIFRVVQGVGAAAMIPSSLALLNHRFAHVPHERASAVGWWTAAGSAAMAAGPTIGGLLIQLASWRYIFFVNVPICVIGFLLSRRLTESEPTGSGKFDLLGQSIWMLSVTALIGAIIEWPKLGFHDPVIWGTLLCALLLFAAFLRIEQRAASPMLPLSLFKTATFNVLLGLGAVLNGCYYGSVFILSLYLQQVLHYSSLTAGLAFLPLTVGFVISNIFSGRIINRYGIRLPILIGLVGFGLGFAGLFIAGPATPYWKLFAPFLIISMGMGLAVPPMINGVLASIDKQLSGTASAILTTSRQTAGAIGVAVFGALAVGNSSRILAAVGQSAAICITFIALAFILIRSLSKR